MYKQKTLTQRDQKILKRFQIIRCRNRTYIMTEATLSTMKEFHSFNVILTDIMFM